ncbi:neuralized-like protein 4 [Ischnura elegans]|uniref:neuralized-like protein 4 n=1 Tax=Ischnura elegans TaxID=197161 RepID=UPI001ED8AE5E|nr:neuralized-like protein 4 [Ischnura elegans]
MTSFQTVLASVFLSLHLFIVQGSDSLASVTQNTCADYSSSKRVVNVIINSKRDKDGEWLTTFKAIRYDGNPDDFAVDVTQTVHDCAGGEAIQISGVIHGNRKNVSFYDTLTFHPKCGSNAGISDDRKSVKKISDGVPLNGVVLTNRPLRRNELFEVRLDKKLKAYSYSLGLGITSYTPDNIKVPDHMFNLKSGNWMYYHSHIYKDGGTAVTNYGRNINNLEVGDRIGLYVNSGGTLHYVINGLDQGPAASNIPNVVYGVFELYYNSAEVTILDPKPQNVD